MNGASEQDLAKVLADYDPQWIRDGLGVRGNPIRVSSFGSPVEFEPARISNVIPPGNEPIMDQGGGGAPGGSTSITPLSFTPIIQNFGAGYVIGVYAFSPLLPTTDHTTTQAITGLLTSPMPDPSDAGWKTTSTTDFGWLEIEFDTSSPPDIISAAIKSTATGTTFTPNTEVEYATVSMSNIQSFARIPLWTNYSDASSNPAIKYQWVTTPITLLNRVMQAYDSTGANPVQINALWL